MRGHTFGVSLESLPEDEQTTPMARAENPLQRLQLTTAATPTAGVAAVMLFRATKRFPFVGLNMPIVYCETNNKLTRQVGIHIGPSLARLL